jgi:urease accessory protein
MRSLLALAFSLAAAPALAHTGHGTDGFGAGFAHPFGGLDHLLAMVAVGVWAARAGLEQRWVWPAVFVSAMTIGASLGYVGIALPGMELLIALSVVVLGAALALSWRATTLLGALVIAACGVAHGWAHGAEAPTEAAAVYMAGFLVATALLHAIGLAIGQARVPQPAVRLAGLGVALAGMVLAAGVA